MGFTATLKEKVQLPGGQVREHYHWAADGGTTTGNIVSDTTIQPEIRKIREFGMSSDSDAATIAIATDIGPTTVKLTFTANDTGDAFIVGPAA